jgi:hypothetical protein
MCPIEIASIMEEMHTLAVPADESDDAQGHPECEERLKRSGIKSNPVRTSIQRRVALCNIRSNMSERAMNQKQPVRNGP